MSDALYKVLGLTRTADEAEVRRAYRKLAKKYHPDANPGDKAAEERFKKISAAYKILKDKESRARYDRGEIDDEGNERAPFGAGNPFAGGFRRGGAGTGGAEHFEFSTRGGGGGFGGFEDIISDLFGGRASGRAAGAGARRGGGRTAMRGEDVRTRLAVDFATAARGGKERIRLADGREVEVNIPAAVEQGQQLRLRGKGQPGMGGGPAGDVLIEIDIRPHATMRREGLDVVVDQPVPLATAVTGGKVRVPTLDGDVTMSIPPWTSSGRLLRLKGRGIDDKRRSAKGDQLVRVMIELPEEPDLELQALLAKSAQAA
ncbi:MAG: J domain-containing protein [Geminicoccaceae bacterium]|nr:J domain-containing protein [Geminicoccaceae bacterium]